MVHSSPKGSPRLAHNLAAEKYDLAAQKPKTKPYVVKCDDIEYTSMPSKTYSQPQQVQQVIQQPQYEYQYEQPAQSQPQQSQPQYEYVIYENENEPQEIHYVNDLNDPQLRQILQQIQLDEDPRPTEYQYVFDPKNKQYVSVPAPYQYNWTTQQQQQYQMQQQYQQQQQQQYQYQQQQPFAYPQPQYYIQDQPRTTRSVSPPSKRFVQTEGGILTGLKELKAKKEKQIAQSEIRKPRNQEYIRSLIENSRRIESQLRGF
jgi:hypothetical protein